MSGSNLTSLDHKQNLQNADSLAEVELVDSPHESAPRIRPKLNRKPVAQSSVNTPSIEKMKNVLSGGFHRDTVSRVTSDDGEVLVAQSDLSRNRKLGELEPFPADPMTNVMDAGQGWSGAVQYGNSMGLSFTLESLRFFQALHTRIDSQLIYPDDFSKQRITGRVRIEAVIGRDGKLIRFTSTMADDRLLQTYCFAVLMQILSQPLPERDWLQTEKTIVAFDFDFFTRVRHNIPTTLPNSVEKNRLAFGRENEIDPWLNEKITEVFTHYIPPIIPFPGGVYIDLVLAYQYVNNLIEGAPTEREVRGERLSKLHEMLRTTLKTMGAAPRPQPTPES
jgi:hypothetical protein